MSYCLYQHVQNGWLYNASLSCAPPEGRPKPSLPVVPSLQAGPSSAQRWLTLCVMTGQKSCCLYANLFRKTLWLSHLKEDQSPLHMLFLLHKLDLQALSIGRYCVLLPAKCHAVYTNMCAITSQMLCCLYQHVQKDSVPSEGRPTPTLPAVPSPHAGPSSDRHWPEPSPDTGPCPWWWLAAAAAPSPWLPVFSQPSPDRGTVPCQQASVIACYLLEKWRSSLLLVLTTGDQSFIFNSSLVDCENQCTTSASPICHLSLWFWALIFYHKDMGHLGNNDQRWVYQNC